MTFEQWMKRVNWWLLVRGYPGTDDLADFDYRSAYDDEATPAEAAVAALNEEADGSLMSEDDPEFWDYMSVSDADPGLQAAGLEGDVVDMIAERRDIDPKQVTRLAAYFREEIFVIETADGRKWSSSRDEYHQMVRALQDDPARRLRSVTAGRHDVVFRVERVEEPMEANDGRGA